MLRLLIHAAWYESRSHPLHMLTLSIQGLNNSVYHSLNYNLFQIKPLY